MFIEDVLACATIAAAISAGLLAQRLREFFGADEAYVWYGTLRVLEGLVPHRDFKSYEPGRYVWSAAFAAVFGRGLGVLRLASHAFYFLGLLVATMGLVAIGVGWAEATLAAVLVASWAHPAYKLFEPALWMWGFGSMVWLLLAPASLSACAAGATVGLSLFFGFNYFLYLGASLGLLWMLPGSPLSGELLARAGLGVVVGAAPFLACCFIPGFFEAFLERRFRSIWLRRTTNLPLPIPWPWRKPPADALHLTHPRQVAIKALFLILPALPAIVILWVASGVQLGPTPSPGVIAAAALGATAWHHALSRADTAHLAQSITPLLLLIVCLLALVPGPPILGLLILTAASLALTWPLNAVAQRRIAPRAFERATIGDLSVWMNSSERRFIDHVRVLCRRELGDGGTLLALPILVTLYPILGLRAPVYDTYCVFPATEDAQTRMLASIHTNDVRLAIIWNLALDGREDLRFSSTHPRVWEYVNREMEPLEAIDLHPDIYAFRARGVAEGPLRTPPH